MYNWYTYFTSLSLCLSLTGEEGVHTLFTGQRERERVCVLHAPTSRKCGRALRVPHSVSQSACVIYICIKLLIKWKKWGPSWPKLEMELQTTLQKVLLFQTQLYFYCGSIWGMTQSQTWVSKLFVVKLFSFNKIF
jgi:hypothetical protein